MIHAGLCRLMSINCHPTFTSPRFLCKMSSGCPQRKTIMIESCENQRSLLHQHPSYRMSLSGVHLVCRVLSSIRLWSQYDGDLTWSTHNLESLDKRKRSLCRACSLWPLSSSEFVDLRVISSWSFDSAPLLATVPLRLVYRHDVGVTCDRVCVLTGYLIRWSNYNCI